MEELDQYLSSLSDKLETDFYYLIEDGSGIYEYFIYETTDDGDRLWFSILPDEDIGYILSMYEIAPQTNEIQDVREVVHSKQLPTLMKKMEDEYLSCQ